MSLASETIFSPSTQADSLDNVDLMARPAALGSAFAGVADDASALFSNPAGLGFLRRGEVLLNSNFWLVGVFQETVLAGFPLKQFGGFAFSANYLDYGTFEGRDNLGSLTSSYGANRVSLEAGGAWRVLPNLALGLGLEGSESSLAGSSYGRLSASLGVLWQNPRGLRLGLSYLNAGILSPGGTSADVINLGGSYRARLDPSDSLLLALGASLEPNGFQYLQGGAECIFQNQLFLRVGYQQVLEDSGLQGLAGLTAGVGLQLSGWSFDYAFLPYGNLGAAHRVTLGYFFPNGGEPAPKPSVKSKAANLPFPNPNHLQNSAFPILPPPNNLSLPPPPGTLPGIGTISPSASLPATPIAVPTGNEILDTGSVTFGPDPSKPKDSLVIQFDLSGNAPASQGPPNGPTMEDLRAQREIVRKNPLDASAWMALGNLYWKLHQKAYALQCYGQALKLEPDNRKLSDWLEKAKSQQ